MNKIILLVILLLIIMPVKSISYAKYVFEYVESAAEIQIDYTE